jgi:hypothetical protein
MPEPFNYDQPIIDVEIKCVTGAEKKINAFNDSVFWL